MLRYDTSMKILQGLGINTIKYFTGLGFSCLLCMRLCFIISTLLKKLYRFNAIYVFGGYLRYKADCFGNTFAVHWSFYYIIAITLYHIVILALLFIILIMFQHWSTLCKYILFILRYILMYKIIVFSLKIRCLQFDEFFRHIYSKRVPFIKTITRMK